MTLEEASDVSPPQQKRNKACNSQTYSQSSTESNTVGAFQLLLAVLLVFLRRLLVRTVACKPYIENQLRSTGGASKLQYP